MRYFGYILLLLIGNGSIAFSQWTAHSFGTNTVIKYCLRPENPAGADHRYCFIQNDHCGGILVDTPKHIPQPFFLTAALTYGEWENLPSRQLVLQLPDTLDLSRDPAQLTLSLYTQNVSRCLVVGKDRVRGWMLVAFDIKKDGYQVPFQEKLVRWEAEKMNLSTYEKDFSLEELAIVLFPRDSTQDFFGYMGYLSLEEEQYASGKPLLPWLDSLLGTPNAWVLEKRYFDAYAQWSREQMDRGQLPFFGAYNSQAGYHSGLLEFSAGPASISERAFFEKLLLQVVDKYPFYPEKQYDKIDIRNTFKAAFRAGMHLNDTLYYQNLSRLMASAFQDPHFALILPSSWPDPSSGMQAGPLRLKTIVGFPQVAAVFAQDYEKALPLGSVVLALDDQALKAVDLQTNDEPGKLMRRAPNDTLQITFADPGNNYQSTVLPVAYDRQLKIGSNFRPVHGDFRLLKDSIYYLRLSTWDGDTYYRLLRHVDQLRCARGLIIDLRGNGGGYGDEVFRSLSLFLHRMETIGQMEYPQVRESILVFPGFRQLSIPQRLPVAMLADDRTACSSEIFILGMKKRGNTLLIGSSFTRGAIASPTLARLPSGVMLKFHYSYGKFIFDTGTYQEGRGLEPDVWVSQTSVTDLFPYEDKLLQYARLLLSKQNH